MTIQRTTAAMLAASLFAAACQSSDQGDSAATEVAEAGSVGAGDPSFEEWAIEVDAALDLRWLSLVAVEVDAWERMAAGDRDFTVSGERFALMAAAMQETTAAFPDPVGDGPATEPYEDFLAAMADEQAAHEDAAATYEADPDEFEAEWRNPEGEYSVTMYTPLEQSSARFDESCLLLSEVLAIEADVELDCDGTETGLKPDLGVVEQTEASSSDVVEADLGGGLLVEYTASERGEDIEFGSDWMTGFGVSNWWIGIPRGLADPAQTPAFDAMIASIPLMADLDDWVAATEEVELLGTGSDQIDGLDARYWDIRVNFGALDPETPPVFALVDADAGSPVGGIQLGPEMGWRMWVIDHPAGPVLFLVTGMLTELPPEVEEMMMSGASGASESLEPPPIEPWQVAIEEADRFRSGLGLPRP